MGLGTFLTVSAVPFLTGFPTAFSTAFPTERFIVFSDGSNSPACSFPLTHPLHVISSSGWEGKLFEGAMRLGGGGRRCTGCTWPARTWIWVRSLVKLESSKLSLLGWSQDWNVWHLGEERRRCTGCTCAGNYKIGVCFFSAALHKHSSAQAPPVNHSQRQWAIHFTATTCESQGKP